ncbi:MAG: helix-turn-helix transcriptional regulator [Gammaproteobacteria bacterium]|nr:helix-turn-helix transcriptional regulator [Gammaproteobacteria bacterium]
MKVNVRRGRVRDLRKQKSWTQEQLAEVAGLHSRTIQHMENEGSTSLGSLAAVAEAPDVEASTLKLSASDIDFAPAATELRKLGSAIFRKIAPTTSQGLPRLFSA